MTPPTTSHPDGSPAGSTPATYVRPDPGPSPGSPEATAIQINAGNLIDRRYRAEKLLGKGGMGEVWCATDTVLNVKVAVKLVPAWVPDDAHARQTLIREAQLGMKLSRPQAHPNIAMVYHVDSEGRFLVSEFIEGDNLLKYMYDQEQKLKREGLPVMEALALIEGIACGLDHAHGMGVIHRDVKPSNVLRSVSLGRVVPKLIDFGIAGELRREATKFTQPGGAGQGSFPYMSPEQLRSARITARADVYSLAASAYHLLAGHLPLEEPGLYHKIQETMPQPIEGLTDAVNAVLLKALAKSPEDRFGTCKAFSDALRDAVEGRGPALPLPRPAQEEAGGRASTGAGRARRWLGPIAFVAGTALGLAFAAFRLVPLLTPRYSVRVKVDSSPPGAIVRLDDGRASLGSTPLAVGLDLSRGRHTFTVEHEGCQTARPDRDVAGAGELSPVEVRLVPLVALSSNPSGARFTVAKGALAPIEFTGTTPATLALVPGPHVVRVLSPPYPAVSTSLDVLPGSTGPVRLAVVFPIPVKISSRPSGARVTCRQHPGEVGRTPWDRALPPDKAPRHDLELTMDGYQTVQLHLSLSMGQPKVTTTVPLVPMTTIVSNPAGVQAELTVPAVRRLGRTPLTLALPAGSYVVTASQPPLLPCSAQFDVMPGAAQPVQVSLNLGVESYFQSKPAGASLVCAIHGERGIAGQRFALVPGAHHLYVSLPGYFGTTRTCEVAPPGPIQLGMFELRPKPVDVAVITVPEGADAWCKLHVGAGEEHIRTPSTMSVLPGHHEIVARLGQFPEHTWPIDIVPGQGAIALNWDFTDEPVMVEIESVPRAAVASCTIHGEHLTYRGEGGLKGELPAGKHHVVVERPGYQPAIADLDLDSGEEPVRIIKNLLPLVHVETHPPAARVLLQDDRDHPRELGTTPVDVTLAQGPHELQLVLPPFRAKWVKVIVDPGTPQPPQVFVRFP